MNGFGPKIDVLTRADLIERGELVAVDEEIALEANLGRPVALTRAAWEDCVAWSDEDNRRKGSVQDVEGRLWDVLWMTHVAIKGTRTMPTAGLPVELYRVPRTGKARAAKRVRLWVRAGRGDDGSPVFTIAQPGQD